MPFIPRVVIVRVGAGGGITGAACCEVSSPEGADGGVRGVEGPNEEDVPNDGTDGDKEEERGRRRSGGSVEASQAAESKEGDSDKDGSPGREDTTK
ncbi:unnamed protein product [Linum trigynum]|uniref:Uncharacterized protein n=1 Tax=Linum trigynum TaxID=586398 RepID=A0AAV2EW06_9ROSI